MYQAIIIDDERWVVKSLLATIRGQTLFNVVGEAYDGISGIELIRRRNPDLVFLDITMPGMNGMDILSLCQLERPETLFIIISGHAEFSYAKKAMLYNAIGYALKPFSREELLEMIQKAYTLLQRRRNKESDPAKASLTDQIPQVENKSVERMLAYIHQNFRQDVTIADLAALCAINPNYVSQLFKQEMNESFSSYLRNLRVQAATELLINTNYSVNTISKMVGYSDYFYFAKVFKKCTHMTPSDYRTHHQANPSDQEDPS